MPKEPARAPASYVRQRRNESMTFVPAGGSRSVRVVSVIRAAII